MTKELIAIELTKIYFSKANKISKEEISNIYYFFLEDLTPRIEIDHSIQVFDINEKTSTGMTDLSKIKPIK